jgi:hypothetical protein
MINKVNLVHTALDYEGATCSICDNHKVHPSALSTTSATKSELFSLPLVVLTADSAHEFADIMDFFKEPCIDSSHRVPSHPFHCHSGRPRMASASGPRLPAFLLPQRGTQVESLQDVNWDILLGADGAFARLPALFDERCGDLALYFLS